MINWAKEVAELLNKKYKSSYTEEQIRDDDLAWYCFDIGLREMWKSTDPRSDIEKGVRIVVLRPDPIFGGHYQAQSAFINKSGQIMTDADDGTCEPPLCKVFVSGVWPKGWIWTLEPKRPEKD